MYEGNWTCSQCSGAITSLPFQPRSSNGLTCRTCWSQNKNGSAGASTHAEPALADAPMPHDDIPDFDDSALASAPPPFDDDGSTATPITPGEKPRFEGAWECAECSGAITSLPFQPRDTSNLKCLDCFKRSKA